MDQWRILYTRAWWISFQNPTLQVDIILLTLENSWFCQTFWPPSDSSALQTGVCVFACAWVCFFYKHCTSAVLTVKRCRCRVVVVSNYTQTLDLLQDVCVHMGYTFCRLDGHTPTGQRQRLVDSFNSPYSQNFLFLLSSKAGGVGLNLIGASHLVLYDIDWNPANDIQVK